jgi:hypothetical protein
MINTTYAAIIELPSTFVASTTGFVSELFGDISPVITLIIGVLLAGLLIEIIVGSMRK